MFETKVAYTYAVQKSVDKDVLFDYLVVDQLPLVEALVYHLVHDKKKEKVDVAEILGLSISRVCHAYKNAEGKF